MKTLSLYELSQEEIRIEDAIIEGGGELTPELEEALNAVSVAKEKKITAYYRVLCHIDDVLPAAKKRRDEISRLITTAENGKKRLREYILDYMQSNNFTKLEGEDCVVSVRDSKETLSFDEEKMLGSYSVFKEKWQNDLPPYIKINFTVDRQALKKAIDDKLPVPGDISTNKGKTIVFRKKL